MTEAFFDYNIQRRRMERMMELIVPHVNRKDEHYGSSWRRRGGPGAFFTIARKWDRLEEAAEKNGHDIIELFNQDMRRESILDDCADLLGYMLVLIDYALYMGYITEDDVIKMVGQSEEPETFTIGHTFHRKKPEKKDGPPSELSKIRKDLRSGPPRIAEPRGYDPEQDDPIEGEGKEGPAR